MLTSSFATRLISRWTIAVAISASSAHAEVVVNSSGTRLAGNIAITADLGETRGGNLFHSFNVFNVLRGESAVFSGPGGIRNVISRVTGGTSDITGLKASVINGPVSLIIPGANFYFINPNGIIFGEYGSIKATGSVYLGTADVVRFADGANFYADTAKNSALTTADPVAFGFLSASPAAIQLNGPQLRAPNTPVPPGKTFALVAGDIDIRAVNFSRSAVIAPGATVNLTSVASPGDVVLGSGAADLSGFASLGNIRLSGGSEINVGDKPTRTGAGSIYIRGGQLTLSPAGLLAQTFGNKDGGVIDIGVRGDMVVETQPLVLSVLAPSVLAPSVIVAGSGSSGRSGGGAVLGGLGAGPQLKLDVGGNLVVGNSSFISSESNGPGAAGDINIRAGGINIQGGGGGNRGKLTGIIARNFRGAAGPSLTIRVGSLQVMNGGIVGTLNTGSGSAGDLTIVADSVLATGDGLDTLSLSTETRGGQAGDLSLNTRTLELRNGARISASTGGFGDAGDVNIVATQQISIEGDLSGIFSLTSATDARVGNAGNAGAINITTPLLLVNGGVIDSTTRGDGDGGTVAVRVGDLQLTNGGQIRSFSGGFSAPGIRVVGSGAAGNVDVNATGNVTVSGVGATRPSGLIAETRGAGAGGDVSVRAWSLTVSDGAVISSSSLGSGLAGNVNIELGDSLKLRGGSITTQATESDGGNITITAPRLIHLVNSRITTSVESGIGSGGNIFIDPQFMVLQNSQIVANAFGGPGGNIKIIAGQFISDPATVISASSTLGIDGTVNIEAPDSDLSADLAALPASFLDASRMMQAGCGAARAGLSSLVEVGRGGLPPAPDHYLVSLDAALPTGGAGEARLNQSGAAMTDFSAPVRIASAMAPDCRR